MGEITVKNNPNVLKPNEMSFEERQKQLAEREDKEQERPAKAAWSGRER